MQKLVVKVGDRLVVDFLVHQENLLRLRLLFLALFQAEQLKAEAPRGGPGMTVWIFEKDSSMVFRRRS